MALSLDSLLRHDEDDDHDHDHDGMSDVVIAKVVAMVVLFAASMFFGFMPMVLAKKFKWIKDEQTASDIKSSNRIVLILLSFGGGVLLCTTFLHLIPEVGENVRHLQEDGYLPELKFHLDALLTCLGFFAMYFVEELVHYFLHKRSPTHLAARDSAIMRSLSIRRRTQNNNVNGDVKDAEKLHVQEVAIVERPKHNHNHNHSHMPISDISDDPVVSSLRGLLIVLALSVHELFEGLAVGLESSAHTVWYMFAAVSAHKLVIAFCVGVELVTAKTKIFLSVIYITTFAAVSPIGIGIGIALSGGAGASESGIASVILQGLASGTLLYVVFFEILQRDRSGFVQFLSSLVGFSVMFAFQFIGDHSHSHSHNAHGGVDEDDGHEHKH